MPATVLFLECKSYVIVGIYASISEFLSMCGDVLFSGTPRPTGGRDKIRVTVSVPTCQTHHTTGRRIVGADGLFTHTPARVSLWWWLCLALSTSNSSEAKLLLLFCLWLFSTVLKTTENHDLRKCCCRNRQTSTAVNKMRNKNTRAPAKERKAPGALRSLLQPRFQRTAILNY